MEEVGVEIREATVTQPTQETGLFTAVSRPECVQKLYLQSDITPRAVFASLGPAGWKSAKDFCLTPVLKNPGETTYTLTKQEVSFNTDSNRIQFLFNQRTVLFYQSTSVFPVSVKFVYTYIQKTHLFFVLFSLYVDLLHLKCRAKNKM